MADSRFPFRSHASEHQQDDRRATEISAGTTGAVAILGLGAVALSIIGLASVAPVMLCAIGIIAAGVAFVLKGGAVAGGYAAVASTLSEPTSPGLVEGGTSMDVTVGLAGIAVGILAILGIFPGTLMAAAIIAFGASFLLSSGAIVRMEHLARQISESRSRYAAPISGTQIMAGLHIVDGLAAIVLGIVALSIFAAPDVSVVLVGLLVTGAMIFVSGLAVSARLRALQRSLHEYASHRAEPPEDRQRQMPTA